MLRGQIASKYGQNCQQAKKEILMRRRGKMRKEFLIVIGALTFLLMGSTTYQEQGLKSGTSESIQSLSASSMKAEADFGRMPLYFIANRGQMDDRVAYYIQGKDKTLFFTSEGVTFVLTKPEPLKKGRETSNTRNLPLCKEGQASERYVVKLDFVSARSDVRPVGEEKTEAVISYFKGKPEEWKTGLPTYSRIIYKNLWPGIDLAYYGTVNRLKYEFIVHPGADPRTIRLAYRGADGMKVNEKGQLEVRTRQGDLFDDSPVAYQEIGGKRASIPLAYLVEEKSRDGSMGDSQKVEAETRSYSYGFRVGEYDHSRPLILDPAVIIYCGYIGGSNIEYGNGIAVDSSGCAYITGYTGSTEDTFPDTVGPDLTFNDGYEDAFVAKVKSDGTGLVYCGYIGGSGDERGNGIAVDTSGCAYITGYTSSSQVSLPVGFPVTVGPDLTFNGGYYDAFVAKVKANGTGLTYCGYIGGSGDDYGCGIAVDKLNYPYITGRTDSDQSSFPITTGPNYQGSGDAFVAEINSDGIGFYYCRYIGGYDQDEGYGIAVDSSYNAYIVGTTGSSESYNFPVTVGPDLTLNGGSDAFVAKVNSSGSTLFYCGYIGGSDTDVGYGIAVDSSGCAYVTGQTASTQATFPESVGPDLTFNGSWDAFAAKVKADGSGLVYCGYIGGSSDDYGQGIAVDSSGNAFITGYTWSTESTFPVTVGPDLTYNDPGDSSFSDAFVAKVKASGIGLVYCGYIGGGGRDRGFAIAVDSLGSAYVTGVTTSDSTTFPAKVGPDLSVGGYDAFVAKIYYFIKNDFNGDGQEDILWRYYGSGGKNAVWYMGYSGSSSIGLEPFAQTSGQKKAMDMFQGNPPEKIYVDPCEAEGLIYQEVEVKTQEMGEVEGVQILMDPTQTFKGLKELDKAMAKEGIVTMLGSKIIGIAYLNPVTDLNWQIVGTGDFNGDGWPDILWRHYVSGYNAVWYMKGATLIGSAYLNAVTGLNWQIVGTGDFNGDGWSDILWRYYGSGGNNVVWYMKGATRIGYAYLSAVTDLNWKIVATGDFNGDGWPDILWRHYLGGNNTVWYMKGVTHTGSASLSAVTDLNWKIVGTGDFNGDGWPDILWRNYLGGNNTVWYMKGVTHTGSASLSAVTDLNWRIENH
jgi:hypothetical protein